MFNFSPASPKPELGLLTGGTYTTCCLTQVKCVHLGSESFLLTAGTDGHLAIWPIRQALAKAGITGKGGFRCTTHPSVESTATQIQWTTHYRIHQSSIKCLALIPFSPTELIIATGGDDNAIAFTRVTSLPELPSPLICSALLIPQAHASTVTGIQWLGSTTSTYSQKKSASFRLASVSNDQRLKTWAVSIDLSQPGVEGLKVKKEANVYSAIADASCMEVIPGEGEEAGGVVIAGIGTETWRIGEQSESSKHVG